NRELLVEVPLPMVEMWEELQAQVEQLTGQAGLRIISTILEDEATRRVGPPHRPDPAQGDGVRTHVIRTEEFHAYGWDEPEASVNSSLQVLRRCLRLAAEWGIIASAPKVRLLRGASRRERVVSAEEEVRYLTAASEPLASIATLLVDTGLRPE